MEQKKSNNIINDTLWGKFLIHPQFRILRHILLLITLSIIIFQGFSIDYGIYPGLNPITFANIFLIFILWGVIYMNLYIFIPRFLFKGKYMSYLLFFIIIILISVGTMFVIIYFIEQHYNLSNRIVKADKNFVLILTSNLITTGFYIFAFSTTIFLQQWLLHNQQIKKLENNQIQSELKELKEQIQPDFLSRILERANTLTKDDPKKASILLLKLSQLLRYQLYDSTRDLVLLSADISFINNYLNLEKIYNNDALLIEIKTEGDISRTFVHPLLFIPIIENAIKHISDNQLDQEIKLHFWIKEEKLFFKCQYPISSKGEDKNDLKSLYRRLELLYNKDYLLTTEKDSKNHTIHLELCL